MAEPALAFPSRQVTLPEMEERRDMSDLQSIAQAQRAFWNSEATRRWVTEQTRIDRLMAEVTDAALTAAAPKPGENVLDIGCGTCTTTLRQAQAVRPTGRVLGIDISEQQLGLARCYCRRHQRGASAGRRHDIRL
jgi:cyclopropane fatty-acyl-phospholipid synthase-like methyltransferase